MTLLLRLVEKAFSLALDQSSLIRDRLVELDGAIVDLVGQAGSLSRQSRRGNLGLLRDGGSDVLGRLLELRKDLGALNGGNLLGRLLLAF